MKNIRFYLTRFLVCWLLAFVVYIALPFLFRDQNPREMTGFATSFVTPEEILLVQGGRFSELFKMNVWASLRTAIAVWVGLALFGLLGKDEDDSL